MWLADLLSIVTTVAAQEASNVPQSAGTKDATTTAKKEEVLEKKMESNERLKGDRGNSVTKESREEESGVKDSPKMEVKTGSSQEINDKRKDVSSNLSFSSVPESPRNASSKTKKTSGEVSGPEVKSVPMKSVVTSNRHRVHTSDGASRKSDDYSPRDSAPQDSDKAGSHRMQSEEGGAGQQRRGRSEPPEPLPKNLKRTLSESKIHIIVSSSVDMPKFYSR